MDRNSCQGNEIHNDPLETEMASADAVIAGKLPVEWVAVETLPVSGTNRESWLFESKCQVRLLLPDAGFQGYNHARSCPSLKAFALAPKKH